MLKRFFVFFTLTPLLFNGVWATVHITEDNHDSHHVPHVHFDTESHFKEKSIDDNLAPESKSSTDDGELEQHEHFHIYLNAYLKSDALGRFQNRENENPSTLKVQLTTLNHTPPVPPPTQ
jgi:hypothetical protein